MHEPPQEQTAPEAESVQPASTAPRQPWQRPTITRIDIQRTMKGSGPTNDGSGSAFL